MMATESAEHDEGWVHQEIAVSRRAKAWVASILVGGAVTGMAVLFGWAVRPEWFGGPAPLAGRGTAFVMYAVLVGLGAGLATLVLALPVREPRGWRHAPPVRRARDAREPPRPPS